MPKIYSLKTLSRTNVVAAVTQHLEGRGGAAVVHNAGGKTNGFILPILARNALYASTCRRTYRRVRPAATAARPEPDQLATAELHLLPFFDRLLEDVPRLPDRRQRVPPPVVDTEVLPERDISCLCIVAKLDHEIVRARRRVRAPELALAHLDREVALAPHRGVAAVIDWEHRLVSVCDVHPARLELLVRGQRGVVAIPQREVHDVLGGGARVQRLHVKEVRERAVDERRVVELDERREVGPGLGVAGKRGGVLAHEVVEVACVLVARAPVCLLAFLGLRRRRERRAHARVGSW